MRHSHHCTCLGHLGQRDTDRIISIYVMPPRQAVTAACCCHCRWCYRTYFCQYKRSIKVDVYGAGLVATNIVWQKNYLICKLWKIFYFNTPLTVVRKINIVKTIQYLLVGGLCCFFKGYQEKEIKRKMKWNWSKLRNIKMVIIIQALLGNISI